MASDLHQPRVRRRALLLAAMVATPACSSKSSAPPTPTPPPKITDVVVTANPNNVLSATVAFRTDRPAVARAHVVNQGAPANTFDTPPETQEATTHSLSLLGMRAQSSFAVTLTATDAEGHAGNASTTLQTPALPPTLPPITVISNDKTRTAPGYVVLTIWEYSGAIAGLVPFGSYMVALDSDLEVVWYYHGDLQDPQKLPNGHFVALTNAIGLQDLHPGWSEFDMMGNAVTSHSAAELGLDCVTHAITVDPPGLLTLSTQLRTITGYDSGAPTRPVVGSLVAELGFDGGARIVSNTFDIFDVHDQGNPNFFSSGFWDKFYPDAGHTQDWTHDNAVVRDPGDGTVIASSRTHSWIYKVRRDGSLVWRLGPGGDFALTNPGETFQYGQHGAVLTSAGTIMCFDDGNNRPLSPGQTPFSRAVEFSLDTTAMQATIVWQYQDGFDSFVFGSSYLLPNGNVLVDDGCELDTPSGALVDSTNLKSARVVEVTHTTPATKVAELQVRVPIGAYAPDPLYSGFGIYRAYKWPSLY